MPIISDFFQKTIDYTINTLGTEKKYYAVIDDTSTNKRYSEFIEGACFDYSSTEKKSIKCISHVVLAITDGDVIIPLDSKQWICKDILNNQYKSKMVLAQELIEKWHAEFKLHCVLADGAYAKKPMLDFLESKKILYAMRAPRNACVSVQGEKKAQLRVHKQFQLRRNERCRTERATWGERDYFFTAEKHINKHCSSMIVYIISNMNCCKKMHVINYSYRWKIEEMFRTMKQSLGMQDCQSRSSEKQLSHIKSVFLAYILCQYERIIRLFHCVEDAIKHFRNEKYESAILRIAASHQTFSAIA